MTNTMDDKEPGPSRAVPPLMVAAWEGTISDPDPLAALGAARALAAVLSTWESRLVSEAIEAGATVGGRRRHRRG